MTIAITLSLQNTENKYLGIVKHIYFCRPDSLPRMHSGIGMRRKMKYKKVCIPAKNTLNLAIINKNDGFTYIPHPFASSPLRRYVTVMCFYVKHFSQ